MRLPTRIFAAMCAASLAIAAGCSNTADNAEPVAAADVVTSEDTEPAEEPAAEEPVGPDPEPADAPADDTEDTTADDTASDDTDGDFSPATIEWVGMVCESTGTTMDIIFQTVLPDAALSDDEYFVAERDYFISLHDAINATISEVEPSDPPALPDGEHIHQAYIEHLEGFSITAFEAADQVSQTGGDRDEVAAAALAGRDNLQLLMMEEFAPDGLDEETIYAVMDLAPACTGLN